ncbi:MAG: GNAT family N-acetyltransferase [Kiloniellaceae bacterium]
MRIRGTSTEDLPAVLHIHRAAFGQQDEAELTRALLADPTARPVLSLIAEENGHPLGHILFSRARLTNPDSDLSATLLAPLAVVPEAQGQGIGGRLIAAGLDRLRQDGVALAFVLGDPAYYTRFGFAPAGPGLDPPYRLPAAYAEAWMVQALSEGVSGKRQGTVICADALMQPALWRE